MKNRIISLIALAFLTFTFSACSFSTANISELKFGKNDRANPAGTSFNVGEKVFCVATVANAMGKHKVNFNLKYDNVAGKTKGESVAKTDIAMDGSGEAFFNFTAVMPGTYTAEASITDEDGKEFSKKSGTVTITGSAPAAPAAPAADQDDEDKTNDK